MEILNESNRLLKKIIKSVFAPLFVESEYENEEEISEKDILDDKQLDEKMKKILAEGLKEATKYDYIIQQDNSSNKTLNDTKINRQTLEEKEVVNRKNPYSGHAAFRGVLLFLSGRCRSASLRCYVWQENKLQNNGDQIIEKEQVGILPLHVRNNTADCRKDHSADTHDRRANPDQTSPFFVVRNCLHQEKAKNRIHRSLIEARQTGSTDQNRNRHFASAHPKDNAIQQKCCLSKHQQTFCRNLTVQHAYKESIDCSDERRSHKYGLHRDRGNIRVGLHDLCQNSHRHICGHRSHAENQDTNQ